MSRCNRILTRWSRLLLPLLLVSNQFILISLLSLRILRCTLLMDGCHTTKMIQFQQFQRLLIYLCTYLSVDIALLLYGNRFVI